MLQQNKFGPIPVDINREYWQRLNSARYSNSMSQRLRKWGFCIYFNIWYMTCEKTSCFSKKNYRMFFTWKIILYLLKGKFVLNTSQYYSFGGQKAFFLLIDLCAPECFLWYTAYNQSTSYTAQFLYHVRHHNSQDPFSSTLSKMTNVCHLRNLLANYGKCEVRGKSSM